jgi:hypothetical protein
VQNAEWWRLHEKGSLGTFTHHGEQIRTNKSNGKSDMTDFSNDRMEMMQTEELKKCKAWGRGCADISSKEK